jgi:hypothetical protein
MFYKSILHLIAILLLLLCSTHSASAQKNKYEREYRIKKSQFPEKALKYIDEKLEDARRIRFYKETDSTKTSYEAKFKKDRLKYSVEFSEEGVLEDIEVLIRAVDIPDDSFSEMNGYLKRNFRKYRIRKIQQQYPMGENDAETTVKHAFQNLMLPYIKYELIVAGKKEKGYARYEVLFDAEGRFENIRKSLPPNYDHVLY